MEIIQYECKHCEGNIMVYWDLSNKKYYLQCDNCDFQFKTPISNIKVIILEIWPIMKHIHHYDDYGKCKCEKEQIVKPCHCGVCHGCGAW